jgi:hypothetical protein
MFVCRKDQVNMVDIIRVKGARHKWTVLDQIVQDEGGKV